MKVFFDSTVWCGGILSPSGLNAALLDLASTGGPLVGITSDVVLLEFYRVATGGYLRATFEPDEVWNFAEAHEPIVETAPIGRRLPDRADLHNLPIGQIAYHLTGQTREDLLAELDDQPRLGDFDANDLHVLSAAAQAGADAICSMDTTFVPIGGIEIYRPAQLAAEFALL